MQETLPERWSPMNLEIRARRRLTSTKSAYRNLVGPLFFFAALAIPEEGQTAPVRSVAVKADKVVVLKMQRRLDLVLAGQVVRSYHIALGRQPVGQKFHEGDGKTPEGSYVIDWRNPKSRFYRSLHISYPSDKDRRAALLRGISPGGDIVIHGLPNGLGEIGNAHSKWDWTEGCVAVTNDEMDEIWSMVGNGTPIEIRP